MKMKTKALLFILVVVAIGIFCMMISSRPWYAQPQKIFEKNREALEGVVEEYLADGIIQYPEIDGITQVNEWSDENPILEFMTDGFGIASASTYKGFYYSVNDVPVAFQGGNEQLTYTDDGWYEWAGVGDNGGRTKQIDGNWYVFEAHF